MNARLFTRSLVRLSDERDRSLNSSFVIYTQMHAAFILCIYEKLRWTPKMRQLAKVDPCP